jgi:hypothetical protein
MLGDYIGPLANPMTDLKASEGESPIPLDRVFYRFNFSSSLSPSVYQSAYVPYKQVNLFTKVFGFEKTFYGVFSAWVLWCKMDKAVAAAYGWTDLNHGHGFHRPWLPAWRGTRCSLHPGRRSLLARTARLASPTASCARRSRCWTWGS